MLEKWLIYLFSAQRRAPASSPPQRPIPEPVVRPVVRFGPFEIDEKLLRLCRAGRPVKLPSTPFRVLSYLIEHRDRVVSKNELMDVVWPGVEVNEGSLSTAINQIRRALGDDRHHQSWVKTIRGHGFRFVGEARSGVSGAASNGDIPPRRRFATTLSAIADRFGWRVRAARSSEPPSVAVLPFADLSLEGDYGYLADGIAEQLIHRLAQIPELRVTAPTSAFAFKGQDMSLPEIGRQLDVGVIVEGSLRRSNGRVHVTTQLVSVENESRLWFGDWERPYEDLFAIEEKVASALAKELRVKLVRNTRHPSSQKLEAYELCIRGYGFVHAYSMQSLDLAIDTFKRALTIDPDYALAHAGLSEALAGAMELRWYALVDQYGTVSASPFFERAVSAAHRAIALDPDLPEGRAALAGILYEGAAGFRTAMRENDRALALSPSSALAHMRGAELKAELGQLDEALEAIEHSMKLDPLSPVVLAVGGHVNYLAGNSEAAIELVQRANAKGYDRGMTEFYLMCAYLAADRNDEAYQLYMEHHGPEHPGPETEKLRSVFDQGGIRAFLKLHTEWESELTGSPFTASPLRASLMFAYLGETEAALDCLEECERRSALWHPKSEPLFAQYRQDPRFVALLERRGVL